MSTLHPFHLLRQNSLLEPEMVMGQVLRPLVLPWSTSSSQDWVSSQPVKFLTLGLLLCATGVFQLLLNRFQETLLTRECFLGGSESHFTNSRMQEI